MNTTPLWRIYYLRLLSHRRTRIVTAIVAVATKWNVHRRLVRGGNDHRWMLKADYHYVEGEGCYKKDGENVGGEMREDDISLGLLDAVGGFLGFFLDGFGDSRR